MRGMRIAAAIIAFVLAAVGLLWAFLAALLISLFLFQNRHGGLRMAFDELFNEADPQRLALAGCALAFGLGFLLLGMALLRGGKPPE